MAIEKTQVRFNDNILNKYRSTIGRKIQCDQDGNIYNIAYTTINSENTFSETELSIDTDIKYVGVNQIYDFDPKVLAVISSNNDFVKDSLDGKLDNTDLIDSGHA